MPGTLVSLAAQRGGREGTAEEGQRGERAMGGRGHSLLTWKESTHHLVIGRWKYRGRERVPEFTRERDERLRILVNSCIREVDRIGVWDI